MALAAAGGAGLLAGCGDDDDAEPLPTAAASVGTPIAVVPGFADPQRWAGRVVRVGGWGGEVQSALRERVWQPFAAATGCTIQDVTTDYDQLKASLERGTPFADLLLVDAIWAETALAEGLVEALPEGTVDPENFAPFAVSEAAVPAFAYAMVSAFRRDTVGQASPPSSWREWWDSGVYPVPRSLPRQAFGTFEFALLADGIEPSALYPLDGQRAVEKLTAISGKVAELWWERGEEPVLWLQRRRAEMVAAWHHRVVASQLDGRPVDFIWDEGLVVADQWVVPRGAPAADVGRDLMAYATTAEAQANLAATVPLGPVVPDAFALIEPRVAARLPTNPAALDKLGPCRRCLVVGQWRRGRRTIRGLVERGVG